MPDAILHPNPGPLHQINDDTARLEIENLWQSLKVGRGEVGSGDKRWVTLDELRAVEAKIGDTTTVRRSGYTPIVQGGSSVGGGGLDLRPLDNTWTGHNTFDRVVAGKDDPTVRLQSLRSFPIFINPQPPEGQILLDTGYTTLLDVRKSSSNSLEAAAGGGNAAIYVQHRVDGTTASVNNVSCGVRVQLESQQTANFGLVNDAVAGYFGILTKGVNVGAFGVHVDAYHRSSGFSVTYGFDAEMLRWSLDGKTIAYHARTIGSGGYTQANDWAFLASPESGGAGKFKVAFGAGSDFIGPLTCDVGLDLGWASCNLYSIVLPPDRNVLWNGPSTVGVGVTTKFNSQGWLEWKVGTQDTFRIDNTGRIHAWNGIALNNAGLIGTPGQAVLQWDAPGRLAWKIGGGIVFSVTNAGIIELPGVPTFGLTVTGLAGHIPMIVQGTLVLVPYFTP
jgi:hypothetical protein